MKNRPDMPEIVRPFARAATFTRPYAESFPIGDLHMYQRYFPSFDTEESMLLQLIPSSSEYQISTVGDCANVTPFHLMYWYSLFEPHLQTAPA